MFVSDENEFEFLLRNNNIIIWIYKGIKNVMNTNNIAHSLKTPKDGR